MIKVNDQMLLSPEYAHWVDQLKAVCRTDLYAFAKIVLNYNLLEERIHAPICAFLTDSFLDGWVFPQLLNEKKKMPSIKHEVSLRRRRKLIMTPRDCFKSTLVSKALPLFILKEYPNASILLDSEVKENSIKFLREIKEQIENNYLFRVLYGDWVSKKWSETEIIISKRFKPQATPSIMVTGANSTTTSQHYDFQILDDLHSFENTSSAELIEKTVQHWRELINQLKPGGIQFIVGTTYTLTDLYAHIQANFKDEFDIFKISAYNPDGTLWFPERLSEDYLEERRGKTQREREIFNAQFLLDPSPIGERKIDITKIKNYGQELDVSYLNLFLIVDPANSTRKKACRSAIGITGMDSDKNSYLIDYVVGRWSPDEVVSRTVEMALKWHPAKFPLKGIGVEAESGYEFFASNVREKLVDAGIVCPFAMLKSKGMSKESRILKVDGLEMCVNEGHFYINPNMSEFIQEANFFPKGTTMDLLDMVAYHFFVAYPPPQREKKIIHDDWYEVQEFAEQQMFPKNKPQYHPVFGRVMME